MQEFFPPHTVRVQENIFKQFFIEVDSLHLYLNSAPFASKLVNYSIKAQWVFEHSQEVEIGDIFLWKQRFVDVQAFFKGSLWPKDLSYQLL